MQKRQNLKQQTRQDELEEPIGIVISRGSRTEDAPRFSAYVWGPVPEAVSAADLVAVA
jgi:hypothetical protein